jgi:nitroimidazol reductase NimA-like FMN-containing flavoprotein (pyridoxamine 5'-phosphate oxidase superfamily)
VPEQQTIAMPKQVIDYLRLHHIVTLGTSSFTGMPHAATTAYVGAQVGIYFSMRPDQITIRNIAVNHWASFTIDDYTPDFRKVRELRGVGRCEQMDNTAEHAVVIDLFTEKLPSLTGEALTNLHRVPTGAGVAARSRARSPS